MDNELTEVVYAEVCGRAHLIWGVCCTDYSSGSRPLKSSGSAVSSESCLACQ